METIIGSAISAVVAIIACIVNNNVQRVREQAAIEQKIDAITLEQFYNICQKYLKFERSSTLTLLPK